MVSEPSKRFNHWDVYCQFWSWPLKLNWQSNEIIMEYVLRHYYSIAFRLQDTERKVSRKVRSRVNLPEYLHYAHIHFYLSVLYVHTWFTTIFVSHCYLNTCLLFTQLDSGLWINICFCSYQLYPYCNPWASSDIEYYCNKLKRIKPDHRLTHIQNTLSE